LARQTPSILIAGVSSGCGKTTLTLGLMAAMKDLGLKVQPFKCGPDFIDPTLHRMVTGRISWNLDLRMCGKDYVKGLFRQQAVSDGINVIEGVMGFFDGAKASTAQLARHLSVPVVLVVDASSAAESVAAVVRGFEELMPDLQPSGVILNKVASNRHLELIGNAISRYCNSRLLGALPRDKGIKIPSRHLGLFMGEESPLGRDISKLSRLTLKHVDVDAIIHISKDCKGPEETNPAFSPPEGETAQRPKARIGVARDKSFCFYYQDNLEILKQAGATLIPFSPMADERLPEGICGLYLGGGYPELFPEILSENGSMRREIREFSRKNMPVFAECGGFMYLCRSITTLDGKTHEMAGIYPAEAVMQKRLSSLGYRELTLKRDCPLGRAGKKLFGHEFHYSTVRFSSPMEKAFLLEGGRKEGYLTENTLAGYIHIHFGRSQEAASHFVGACQRAKAFRSKKCQ